MSVVGMISASDFIFILRQLRSRRAARPAPRVLLPPTCRVLVYQHRPALSCTDKLHALHILAWTILSALQWELRPCLVTPKHAAHCRVARPLREKLMPRECRAAMRMISLMPSADSVWLNVSNSSLHLCSMNRSHSPMSEVATKDRTSRGSSDRQPPELHTRQNVCHGC